MISFDLFYGIVTAIFNFVTFIFFILFYMQFKKTDIHVFLARIFLKADRFILAFIFLWIAEISLTIGYVVADIVAFTNPYTLIWEYTNIAVFFFLMLFFIFFTGLYMRRRGPKQSQPSQNPQQTQSHKSQTVVNS